MRIEGGKVAAAPGAGLGGHQVGSNCLRELQGVV